MTAKEMSARTCAAVLDTFTRQSELTRSPCHLGNKASFPPAGSPKSPTVRWPVAPPAGNHNHAACST